MGLFHRVGICTPTRSCFITRRKLQSIGLLLDTVVQPKASCLNRMSKYRSMISAKESPHIQGSYLPLLKRSSKSLLPLVSVHLSEASKPSQYHHHPHRYKHLIIPVIKPSKLGTPVTCTVQYFIHYLVKFMYPSYIP